MENSYFLKNKQLIQMLSGMLIQNHKKNASTKSDLSAKEMTSSKTMYRPTGGTS